MYSISYRKKKVIGTDDRGEENLLLDLSDVYMNFSGTPLRTVEKDAQGEVRVIEIIWEEISGRHDKYKALFGSDEKTCAMLVLDHLMAGKLISTPGPVLTAIVDAGQKETAAVSDSTGWFDPSNAALGIRSDGRNDIFKEQGFDMVVIFADDMRAEQQLRTASLLLSEKGMLLMINENTRYFKCAADLFIAELKEIHIDSEISLLYAEGRKAFRKSMEEPQLNDEYRRICEKISCVTNSSMEENTCKAVEIYRDINDLVNAAQKQWEPDMKQQLLDLKEAFQIYILNRDDRYSGEYREELERMLEPGLKGKMNEMP